MSPLAEALGLSIDRDSEVPVGTQLAWKLRALVEAGALREGEQLPSVRDLASHVGVNVNTARAVYGRLEREGIVSSEQGRGTFVLPAGATNESAERRRLRRQIAALEAELVRRPQPGGAQALPARPAAGGGRLPTTDELRDIRDGLGERLRELDAERADVLRRLAELQRAEELEPFEVGAEEDAEPARHSSASLRGARVRWVGA